MTTFPQQGVQVQPPVTPAIALVVIAVVLGVGGLLVQLATVVLPLASFEDPELVASMVLGGILLAGGLISLGLGLALLILSILVVVRGRGLLRRGGIVLIVAWALGVTVNVTTSGDPAAMSDGMAGLMQVVTILGIVVGLLRAVLLLVGAGILAHGISALRRGRAGLPTR